MELAFLSTSTMRDDNDNDSVFTVRGGKSNMLTEHSR